MTLQDHDQELVQLKVGKWSYGSNGATSVWYASGHKIMVVSDSLEKYTTISSMHFHDGKWQDVLPWRKVHQPKDVVAAVRESEDAEFVTYLHHEAVARTVEFLDK